MKFAVIFDLDGVIVLSNHYHKRAWRQFFHKHGLNIGQEELKRQVYGKINFEILSHYFGKLSKTQIQKYVEEKESLYRSLIKSEISSPNGLLDFLLLLKKKGVAIAIATSAPPKNVAFVLKNLNLRKYFEVILDDTTIKKGKPHPEIYLKIAKKIKHSPKYCIVIEDSLSGIEAALKAGMNVIGITTTHNKKELLKTNMVITNFTELSYEKLDDIVKSGLKRRLAHTNTYDSNYSLT